MFGSKTELYLTLFNSNFWQNGGAHPLSILFHFLSLPTKPSSCFSVIDSINRDFTIWVLGRLFQDLLGVYRMNYERDTNPVAGDNCVSLAYQLAHCYCAEHLLEATVLGRLFQDLLGVYCMNYERDTNLAAGDN